jgi:hypothetical protein
MCQGQGCGEEKKMGGAREIFSKFYGVLRNILDVKGYLQNF